MSLLGRYRSAWSGLPPELWRLAWVVLVHRAGSMVLPFLALWLTGTHGFGVAEAGQAVALFGLGSLVGNAAGGRLADRFGPLVVLAASLVVGGLLLVLLGFLAGPVLLRVVIFLQAAAIECGRPAGASAVAALAPPAQRTRAFALWRTAVNVGTTIGPAIGGVLAVIDYRLLFVVDGLSSVAAALVLVRSLGLRLAAPERGEPAGPSRSPWRDGLFLAVLAVLFLHATIFFQIIGTFGLFLVRERGFSEPLLGLAFGVNTLVIGIWEMPLVSRLAGRRSLTTLSAGAALVGLGLGLLAFAHGTPLILATVLVWTLGEMLVEPFAASFVASRAGEANRGRFLGLHSTSYALAFMAAPLAGTALWERFGPDALWYACALGGALAAGAFALIARRGEAAA